nr:PREDICTED: uncharacterized protein LOC109039501 isoform X2 [Bemisia tabaci]
MYLITIIIIRQHFEIPLLIIGIMKELTRLYAVLLFPPEKGTEEETVNVVPQSWVKKEGKICLWPKIKNPKKLIEECTSPVDVACEWQEFEYKAKCKENIEGYSKAKIVEKNVLDEKESNLSEISDVPKKRPRMPKNPFSPSAMQSTSSSPKSCVSLEEINDADVESEENTTPIRRRSFRQAQISPLPEDDSPVGSNQTLTPKYPTPPTKRVTPIRKSHCNASRSLFADGEGSAKNTKPPSNIRLVKTCKSHQNIAKEPSAQVSSNSDHKKSRQSHTSKTIAEESFTNPTPELSSSFFAHSDHEKSRQSHTSKTNAEECFMNPTSESSSSFFAHSDHEKSRQSHTSKTNAEECFMSPTSESSSGPSASLDFSNLFMPTSKSLTTFHTQWRKMNAQQKDLYQAETLFVLRRTLPLMVTKLGPGIPGTSAAIDSIKAHPNLTCFPINDEDDLNKAEKLLKMKGWKQKLETLLLSKKCKDLRETARAMCSFLFTDQFGSGYSMVGQKKKKSFVQLPLVTLLKKTISSAFNTKNKITITDEEINEAVEAWLKYCKNHLTQKAKPGKKRKEPAELPPSDEEEAVL